ncbi:MAG: SHOCT domain-containing protein [Rhodospirillales bacterium]|nr:SHOCT domain-containing protein [Rhodospirillales bacterium]
MTGRIAAAGTIFTLAPALAWAQQQGEPYGYGPHMMWWGGWPGMVFGPLFMILALAAVIAVVVLLVRWLGGPWQGTASPHPAPPNRTPLDILKERFARGEIDKDEFEERRRVLGE